MSCGCGKPPSGCKPEGDTTQQKCLEKKAENACDGDSGGFFSWLFGGSSSTSEDSSREKCPGGCGMDKCNCNCALRDHLKQCCDYGKLPALVTKDSCPTGKKEEMCVEKKVECAFLPVDTTCKPKTEERPPAFICSTDKKEEKKCCMPCTDTTGCVPSWMCPPVASGVRTYPAPAGVNILPISATGRNAKKAGKCGECGTVSTDEKAKPNVSNPNCPMVRSRDCNADKDKDKKDEGFLCSLVRKATEIKELCNEIKEAAEKDNDDDCDCSVCKEVQSGPRCFQNAVQQQQCCGAAFQNPSQPFQDFKIPPGTEITKKPTEVVIPEKSEKKQEEPIYCYEVRPLSFCEDPDPCKVPDLPPNPCPPEEPASAQQIDPCPPAPTQQIDPCQPAPTQQIDPCQPAPTQQIDPCQPAPVEPCPEPVKEAETAEIDETPVKGDKNENCCRGTKDPEPENAGPPPETKTTCPARSRARKCRKTNRGVSKKPGKLTENACPPQECPPCPEQPPKPTENAAPPADGNACLTPEKKAEDCCCCNIISELKPPAMLKENPPKECCILLKVSVVQESQKSIEAKCNQNGGRCMKKDPCVCDPAFFEDQEDITAKDAETEDSAIGDCDPTIVGPVEKEKPNETGIDVSSSQTQSVVKVVICCEDGLAPTTIVNGKPVYGPEQIATEETTKPVEDDSSNACVEPEEINIVDKMCTCRRCVKERGGSPEEYIQRNLCCSRCGQTRGTNECCVLCRFVNKMESGCRPKPKEEEDDDECDCDDCAGDDDICNSDVFELNLEGKPIYEGGMCLNRARHFLWKNSEGPSFRDLAFMGTVYTGYGAPAESASEDGEEMECTCEEHMKMMEKNKYRGGMELNETLNYLWSRPIPK